MHYLISRWLLMWTDDCEFGWYKLIIWALGSRVTIVVQLWPMTYEQYEARERKRYPAAYDDE